MPKSASKTAPIPFGRPTLDSDLVLSFFLIEKIGFLQNAKPIFFSTCNNLFFSIVTTPYFFIYQQRGNCGVKTCALRHRVFLPISTFPRNLHPLSPCPSKKNFSKISKTIFSKFEFLQTPPFSKPKPLPRAGASRVSRKIRVTNKTTMPWGLWKNYWREFLQVKPMTTEVDGHKNAS